MTNLLLRLFVKDADNTDSPKVRAAIGTLSGLVGIVCNILLFAFKLLVGTLTSSVSITADAMNNLSDASGCHASPFFINFTTINRFADTTHEPFVRQHRVRRPDGSPIRRNGE